jgi:6-phospho-beta-glucosidase
MGIKIAVIGAGSTYTPELMEGLIQRGTSINLEEVSFYDIDSRRLNILYDFSLRMVEAAGSKLKLTKGMDLKKVVSGADFIINQVRVAGQEGRIFDERLGIKNDIIGQETTGVGGFSKALRTIPVVLNQCRVYERYAPDAILINFTNPSGIITEAILRNTHINCIGLCNIPVNLRMDIAHYLRVDPEEIQLDYIGLNHLGWVRAIRIGEKKYNLDNLKKTVSKFSPRNIPDMDYPEELLACIGAFPGYYLRYFYLNRAMLKKLKSAKYTRGEEVLRIEKRLLKMYQDRRLKKKPELLSQRGGAYYSKVATSIIDSIVNDRGDVEIVNLSSSNMVEGFEPEEVLEIPAIINKKGATPIKNRVDNLHMFSLMRMLKGYERLTIEAAIEKSFKKAVLALITNPLILDVELAIRLVKSIDKRYKLGLK